MLTNIIDMVGRYSNALNINGIGSEECKKIREEYKSSEEFTRIANSLDGIKQRLIRMAHGDR